MSSEKLTFNRTLYDKQNFSIGIEDLSIHRGYGVFDFMRAYNGKVIWLDRYLKRLERSIQGIGLPLGMSINDIKSDILSLIETNGFKDSSIKIIVTGGYSPDYSSVIGPANVLIINTPFQHLDSALYTDGAKLISHAYTRPFPTIKSIYYQVAMQLYPAMKEAGAIEVLYGEDLVTEASRSNIFFVKNGSIYTPASKILDGITRSVVLDLCDVSEVDIQMEERFHFDEVFITSTVKEVLPITMIDNIAIGDGRVGPVTKDVIATFNAEIKKLSQN